MSIYDDVNQQLKDAMRAKDQERLRGLRGIRAGFINALKEDNAQTLSDDKAVEVLRRLAKQRKDSIDAYTQASREDLAQAEQAELDVIEQFLPKLADEAQTRSWVQEAVSATGAQGSSDIGKVMGYVMSRYKGKVDGSLTRRLAQEQLG